MSTSADGAVAALATIDEELRKLKAIEACLREQAGKRQMEASRTLLNLAEDLASVEENLRIEIGCQEIHDYDVFPFGHIKVN